MLQRLLDFSQKHRECFFQTGIRQKEHGRVDLNIRRSTKIRALGALKEELRTSFRAVLPTMFQGLGTEAFEPRKLEVEMVAHGDGAFYKEHRDTFIEGQDSVKDQTLVAKRLISAVYYFHHLPK